MASQFTSLTFTSLFGPRGDGCHHNVNRTFRENGLAAVASTGALSFTMSRSKKHYTTIGWRLILSLKIDEPLLLGLGCALIAFWASLAYSGSSTALVVPVKTPQLLPRQVNCDDSRNRPKEELTTSFYT